MSDAYSSRQAIKDARYEQEYRAWLAALAPAERRKVEQLGLGQPLREQDGYGWGKTDAADFPEASEPATLPLDSAEPSVQQRTIENEEVLDVLRRLIGELLAESNARLSLECLALVTGFSYLGGTMTEIAKRHAITRAAVSKRCVELVERLNLHPSRAMRSLTARRAYQAAQLSARNEHEKFGNHHV